MEVVGKYLKAVGITVYPCDWISLVRQTGEYFKIPVVREVFRSDWRHIPGTGRVEWVSLPEQNTSQCQALKTQTLILV